MQIPEQLKPIKAVQAADKRYGFSQLGRGIEDSINSGMRTADDNDQAGRGIYDERLLYLLQFTR